MPKATQPVCASSLTLVVQTPDLAEMLAVIVEAHAGGRLRAGVIRDEKLELERVLDLAHGHHLPDAAEERITRYLEGVRERELIGELAGALHPALAEDADLLRGADAHVLAHAEGLQPVERA